MSIFRKHMKEAFRRMCLKACLEGDLETVKMSLTVLSRLNYAPYRSTGACPSAFYLACVSGNLELVEYLFEKNVHLLDSSLFEGTLIPREDGPDACEDFVEYIEEEEYINDSDEDASDIEFIYLGKDLNPDAFESSNSFGVVCQLGYFDLFMFFVEKFGIDLEKKIAGDNLTALMRASSAKRADTLEIIKYLVDVAKVNVHGGWCDWYHNSSFSLAVSCGRLETVRYFVENLGFSKDSYKPCFQCGKKAVTQPLCDAVQNTDNPDVFQYLSPETLVKKDRMSEDAFKAICESNTTHLCYSEPISRETILNLIEENADLVKRSVLVMIFDEDGDCINVDVSIKWRQQVYHAGPFWSPGVHFMFPHEIRVTIRSLLFVYSHGRGGALPRNCALRSFQAIAKMLLFKMFMEIGRLNYYLIEPTWIDFLA